MNTNDHFKQLQKLQQEFDSKVQNIQVSNLSQSAKKEFIALLKAEYQRKFDDAKRLQKQEERKKFEISQPVNSFNFNQMFDEFKRIQKQFDRDMKEYVSMSDSSQQHNSSAKLQPKTYSYSSSSSIQRSLNKDGNTFSVIERHSTDDNGKKNAYTKSYIDDIKTGQRKYVDLDKLPLKNNPFQTKLLKH